MSGVLKVCFFTYRTSVAVHLVDENNTLVHSETALDQTGATAAAQMFARDHNYALKFPAPFEEPIPATEKEMGEWFEKIQAIAHRDLTLLISGDLNITNVQKIVAACIAANAQKTLLANRHITPTQSKVILDMFSTQMEVAFHIAAALEI